MSFPVEAGPESPGHVGHTPQHVDVQLRRARAAGILTSGLVRAYDPVPTAMQPVPQPQGFERLSQTAALLRVEDYRRRLDPRMPWPAAFDRGVILAESEQSTQPPPAALPAAPSGRRTLLGMLRGEA